MRFELGHKKIGADSGAVVAILHKHSFPRKIIKKCDSIAIPAYAGMT